MDNTKLVYQKKDGYVAVMAQMMPTFDAKSLTNTGKIKQIDDGSEISESKSSIKSEEGTLAYYFIVDRSGSMGGNKM